MTDAFVLGGVRTPVGRYWGALSHIRTDVTCSVRRWSGRASAWASRSIASGHVRVPNVANTRGKGREPAGCARRAPDRPRAMVMRSSARRRSRARSRSPMRSARASSASASPVASSRCRARAGPTWKGEEPFSPRGPVFMLDTMWAGAGSAEPESAGPRRLHDDDPHGENVADRYGLSREQIDAFALRSHTTAAAARDSGRRRSRSTRCRSRDA